MTYSRGYYAERNKTPAWTTWRGWADRIDQWIRRWGK